MGETVVRRQLFDIRLELENIVLGCSLKSFCQPVFAISGMALVFVKTNEDGDDVKPLVIRSGSVLSADHLATGQPSTKDEMRDVLNGMKKDVLISTLSSLGLRFNRKSMTNSAMVNLIVEKEYTKIEREAKKSSAASSSVETKPAEETKPVEEEEIPTTGERNLLTYLAKGCKDVKGFHCGYYEGGAFHIFTPYGMYSPDVDDRDGVEIRNHNCLTLPKEDLKELMDDGDEVSEEAKMASNRPVDGIAAFKGYGEGLTFTREEEAESEEVESEEVESGGGESEEDGQIDKFKDLYGLILVMKWEDYLSSAVDFFENPMRIDILAFGGKYMFALPVDYGNTTIYDVKCEILRKIQEKILDED